MADFGSTQHDFGQHQPDVGPSQVNGGRIWNMFGRCWSERGPKSAKCGPVFANVDQRCRISETKAILGPLSHNSCTPFKQLRSMPGSPLGNFPDVWRASFARDYRGTGLLPEPAPTRPPASQEYWPISVTCWPTLARPGNELRLAAPRPLLVQSRARPCCATS